MAADTVAEYIHMIEVCRHPTGGRVTVITSVAASNVGLVLAGCIDAVVAADAIANDTAVIKHGWQPGSCAMTVIALVIGGNVTKCLSG